MSGQRSSSGPSRMLTRTAPNPERPSRAHGRESFPRHPDPLGECESSALTFGGEDEHVDRGQA